MEAFEAILTRRSTRKYKDTGLDKQLIEKVIEAGRYAPSGSNSQSTHFIVITGKDVLAELTDLVTQEFSAMEITEDTYVSLKHSITSAKSGNYIFHYGAPVLIITANRRGYGNAVADSACALENMMIAANALDLGSCWINQLHWLDDNDAVRSFLLEKGLKEDETVTGGLILGYPDSGLPARTPLARKGNPVTWIE